VGEKWHFLELCSGCDCVAGQCDCENCPERNIATTPPTSGEVDESGTLAATVSQQYESGRANAELDQPFTVEWLVEIGGSDESQAVFFESPDGTQFDYWAATKRWTLGGARLATKITTRRDVLKWLDVLGIDVATTKGGAT
jgi:hypothetical protein